MSFNYYFNIGIIYFLIGIIIALIFFFLLKKHTIGKFWGSLIVALAGSYLGALFEFFFKDLIYLLTHINGSVNIFPPIIISFICIWLFSKFGDK